MTRLRTFAALTGPHTYLGAGSPLVGRLVANTEFLRALFRTGGFERYLFFTGESADRTALESMTGGGAWVRPPHVEMRPLLELPRALANGEIDVLHHASHADAFVDLVAMRNRVASGPVVVSGQIHSLSYPRLMNSHVLTLLDPPRSSDAIFCSSTAGSEALARAFASAANFLAARGLPVAPLACERPVVPFGIDCDALGKGDRARGRAALGLPADAPVILALGRFTEYDKMDLFPLIQAFAAVVARARRKPHLVLAGARQGTQTPEMVTLWARLLGVGDRVSLRVDFPDSEKADLLALADIFVSPSDNVQETFGLSVVEAMAAGLAVVVSDFDGYRDTVPDGIGIRVPARWASDPSPLAAYGSLLYERPLHLLLGQSVEIDLGALTVALAGLCDDPDRCARLGLAARQHARTRFDWRVVMAGYHAVWTRLLAQAQVHPADTRPALAMDHRAIFGHYASPPRLEGLVRRSALSRALCSERNQYPVYPELKNLVSDAEIMGVLRLAESPMACSALRDAVVGSFSDGTPLGVYRADFLLGWLLKHGLLERA